MSLEVAKTHSYDTPPTVIERIVAVTALDAEAWLLHHDHLELKKVLTEQIQVLKGVLTGLEALRLALEGKAVRERRQWVSSKVAAEKMGCCEKTIIKRIKKNLLRGHKTGKEQSAPWTVDVTSIERFTGPL